MFFIAVDGDKVGAKLEALIIAEELDKVAAFSQKIANAVTSMKELVEQKHGTIIFIGGDNFLAKFDETKNMNLIIDEFSHNLNRMFFEATGCTISVGVAHRPREAFLALRLAKGTDKTKFIDLRVSG